MTESKFDYKKYKEINDKLCQLWQLRNIRDLQAELSEDIRGYADKGMCEHHSFFARICTILECLYTVIAVDDLDNKIEKQEQKMKDFRASME